MFRAHGREGGARVVHGEGMGTGTAESGPLLGALSGSSRSRVVEGFVSNRSAIRRETRTETLDGIKSATTSSSLSPLERSLRFSSSACLYYHYYPAVSRHLENTRPEFGREVPVLQPEEAETFSVTLRPTVFGLLFELPSTNQPTNRSFSRRRATKRSRPLSRRNHDVNLFICSHNRSCFNRDSRFCFILSDTCNSTTPFKDLLSKLTPF